MSLRLKAENLWYHYKFHILASIFLLVVFVVSLHSCVTRPKYDMQVYYVTGSSPMYTEQISWIESFVSSQCGDVNGDGEITVSVTGVRVGDGSDPTERAKNLNAVQAGDVMLLFGDASGIDYLYRNGYLQPLTDFTDDLDGEGYAWNLSRSDLSSKTEGFDVFSHNLYVSLRALEGTWSSARSTTKANYEVACNTLRSMIAADATVE
ncbi:MAG: hypothetical protein J6B54_06495 [Clostridia bacterium]|nr:hypothetical protein [Clostridia bacterium]